MGVAIQRQTRRLGQIIMPQTRWATAKAPVTRSFREKHASVYSQPAACAHYARLCAAQDMECSLLTAIEGVCLLSRSMAVLDLGSGTGKLSELIAARVSGIIALDRSVEMLRVARALPSIGLVAADIRRIPVRTSSQAILSCVLFQNRQHIVCMCTAPNQACSAVMGACGRSNLCATAM